MPRFMMWNQVPGVSFLALRASERPPRQEDEPRASWYQVDRRKVTDAVLRYLHAGTFTWFDENRIRTQWLQVYEGEVSYKAGFELVRRKK